ncbi:hypothetical protein GGF46_005219 [Coemansia sp. RSA 552]|nr:hypothetical protein GGF46_005219 [Coemansia sp. RSA 552]
MASTRQKTEDTDGLTYTAPTDTSCGSPFGPKDPQQQAYILASSPQLMGGLSPAWSLSSGSSHGGAAYSCGPDAMFPAVDVPSAFAAGVIPPPADTVGMDDWLSQFVNTEAIDGDKPVRGAEVGQAALGGGGLSPLADCLAMPVVPEALDGVAAVLASAAGGMSAEALTSMLAAYGPGPATNIAPQKTLSLPVAPPAKRMRPAGNVAGRLTAAAGSSSPNAPATAVPRQRQVSSTSPGRSLAPASAHLVPLAPRQATGPAVASRPTYTGRGPAADTAGKSAASSRSGSSTPPGLGVLAKIAQRQSPIDAERAQQTSVKVEAQDGGSSPPQSAAAQKRQERLIKNRAAALLSRKRKREYMSRLESEVEGLKESNTSLAKRLEEAERRLAAVTAERDQLRGDDRTAAAVEQPAEVAKPQAKPRAAGALLMAMLFSFSLFTLPTLYGPASQIAVGGGAAVLPPTLPAAEPRLLIGGGGERRHIEKVEGGAGLSNGSAKPILLGGDAGRPMTMDESASLHAWIRRGGAAPVSQRHDALDYAMLYCPTLQHVVLSSDAPAAVEASSGAARVLGVPPAMEDVDDRTAPAAVSSPRVERLPPASETLDLAVPTRLAPPRPRLSLYSPVGEPSGGEAIPPPWDSCDAADRQRYLRIDVEVVGSKWVTADKLAAGLY